MEKARLTPIGLLVCVAIVFVLIGWIGGGKMFREVTHQGTAMITVSKTEAKPNGEEKSKYLVYANEGTYECTDSWWFGKFNSSDVYGKIVSGKTYRVRVAGWRVPLFSWYPNIISASPQ